MNSLLLPLASVLAMLPVSAAVVTVPAPADEPLSSDYQVVADGQPVAQAAGGGFDTRHLAILRMTAQYTVTAAEFPQFRLGKEALIGE